MSDSKHLLHAINWNRLEDPLDLVVWNKLVEQFWVPERFPLANDIKSWQTLDDKQKALTKHVFAGLTLLDTIQGTVGAISLIPDAMTDHEAAVYTNIAFMESIHAKSYSSIFSTLCSTEEIDELFEWAKDNPYLQKKADIIYKYYTDNDRPLHKKIASTFLESFLFYSGFYLPLKWSTKAKLTNTADLIRFIIRDESVHGFYIGAKFQKQRQLLLSTPEEQQALNDDAYSLLYDLYENELAYTADLYDGVEGFQTEDVRRFLRYNANKALMNLGMDPLFPKDLTDVDPAIIASLSVESENGDFFSGTNSYKVIGTYSGEGTEEDWEFGEDD